MGISLFRSNSSYDSYKPVGAPRNAGNDDHETIRTLYEQAKKMPNPDPSNYRIKRSKSLRGNLLIEIRYPDCTNYEGNKILLYKNTTLKRLKNQKHIDPHFSKNKKFKSPIARFEPTKRGWSMGLSMLSKL